MSCPPVRVVIVDDDGRVLTALRETIALEPDLLLVGEAGTAATARGMVDGTNPVVVLMDVLLPDSAVGLDLLSVLSRRAGCSVVAMSIRSDLRRVALAAGAVDFVAKDDDIDALLRSVRSAGRRTA